MFAPLISMPASNAHITWRPPPGHFFPFSVYDILIFVSPSIYDISNFNLYARHNFMRAVPPGQVYDAYVFFDINGDWHLTVVELKLMLKSLAVEVLQPVPHLSHTNCNSLTNPSSYSSY